MRAGPNPPWIAPPSAVSTGLTIGLFGGSFNPAHAGHLHIAQCGLRQFGLDQVWWLVSPQNPLKPEQGMAGLKARLESARQIARHPRFRVLALEQALGTRYTADTLKALQKRFPGLSFVWLMGSDSLASFHHWKNWQSIVKRIPIAVVQRPGSTLAMLSAGPIRRFPRARHSAPRSVKHAHPPHLVVLEAPRHLQSASAIRAATQTS